MQRLSFDDQRLGVRALQFDRAGHEAFHRVGDIVRLIEHVCRPEVGRIRELGLDQFVEDQEQPEGLDRAGVEIVVAVLRIVEMKPPRRCACTSRATIISMFTFGAWCPRSTRQKAFGPSVCAAMSELPQSWMTVA